MLAKADPLAMRIAPALMLCFCTLSFLFSLSRADLFSASTQSWRSKNGSVFSTLTDTHPALSHKAPLHGSKSNRQFEMHGTRRKTRLPRAGPPATARMEPTMITTSAAMVTSPGTSASPTPIPAILFDGVYICKARNPVRNIGILNKMGELLLVAYPTSEEKAQAFARCIREDVTRMKREEYLSFAQYNCVGTMQCVANPADGSCSCPRGAPERCINVEYTRALTACRYT